MNSFVNLMANDVWSAGDIKARLHAEIRSEISEQSEEELNRALQGKMLGMHTMTANEIALLKTFKVLTDRVTALGIQARADMVLLNSAMSIETAQRRLTQEVVLLVEGGEPLAPVNSRDVAMDVQERATSQSLIDTASKEVTALTLLRDLSGKGRTR